MFQNKKTFSLVATEPRQRYELNLQVKVNMYLLLSADERRDPLMMTLHPESTQDTMDRKCSKLQNICQDCKIFCFMHLRYVSTDLNYRYWFPEN